MLPKDRNYICKRVQAAREKRMRRILLSLSRIKWTDRIEEIWNRLQKPW
jgi:hypothetical protein